MTLLGGDPGIGKSTLLLQLAGMLVEPEARRMFDGGPEVAQPSLNGAASAQASINTADPSVEYHTADQQVLDRLERSLNGSAPDSPPDEEEEMWCLRKGFKPNVEPGHFGDSRL